MSEDFKVLGTQGGANLSMIRNIGEYKACRSHKAIKQNGGWI